MSMLETVADTKTQECFDLHTACPMFALHQITADNLHMVKSVHSNCLPVATAICNMKQAASHTLLQAEPLRISLLSARFEMTSLGTDCPCIKLRIFPN